jgi:hypothetical protein
MTTPISTPTSTLIKVTETSVLPFNVARHAGIEVGVPTRVKVIALVSSVGPRHRWDAAVIGVRVDVVPSRPSRLGRLMNQGIDSTDENVRSLTLEDVFHKISSSAALSSRPGFISWPDPAFDWFFRHWFEGKAEI